MRGRRLLQSNMHDWFIQEVFYSSNRNARGKRNSNYKANLKAAGRRVRRDKSYLKEVA